MNGQRLDQLKDGLKGTLPDFFDLVWIAVGVSVLIWVTFRIRAWFREGDASAGHNTNLLFDLRELHRQGGLSDEEFRLIKSQLAGNGGGEKHPRKPQAKAADEERSSSANSAGVPVTDDASLQGRSDLPCQDG